MDSQGGEARPGDLDVDGLALHPLEGHLRDVLDEEEFAAEQLGMFVELPLLVAVPVDGQVDAVDVPEVVVDQ